MPRRDIHESGLIIFEVLDYVIGRRVEIAGADVTTDIYNLNFTRVATDRLSNCSIELNNYEGKYNYIKAGDVVLIYLDYSTGATLQFRGKVDLATPGFAGDFFIRIQGRDRPELNDMKYTGRFSKSNAKDVFSAIVSDINTRTGYTVVTYASANFPDSSIVINYSFRKIPYLQALQYVARKAGWEFRIDTDVAGTIYARNKGDTELRTEDPIAIGVNFMFTDGIADDSTSQKNYITVIGDNSEGCIVLWTKKADSLDPWIKEESINDTSITTRQEAEDRADMEFNEFGTARKQGLIKCIGIPTLILTYGIEVFIPYVIEGVFQIKEYTHSYSPGGFDSSIVLEQRTEMDLDLLKKNEQKIREQQDFENPNNMLYSYPFKFDDDSLAESLTNAEITNGKLKLNTSFDAGIFTSKSLTIPENAASMELRFNGNDDCDLCTFQVSADDGENYTTVTPGTKGNPGSAFSVTAGKKIKARVNLISSTDNPRPEIESMVALAKT